MLRVFKYIQGPQTKNYLLNPQIIIQMKYSSTHGSIGVIYLVTLKSGSSKQSNTWLEVVSDSVRVLRQEIIDVHFSMQ